MNSQILAQRPVPCPSSKALPALLFLFVPLLPIVSAQTKALNCHQALQKYRLDQATVETLRSACPPDVAALATSEEIPQSAQTILGAANPSTHSLGPAVFVGSQRTPLPSSQTYRTAVLNKSKNTSSSPLDLAAELAVGTLIMKGVEKVGYAGLSAGGHYGALGALYGSMVAINVFAKNKTRKALELTMLPGEKSSVLVPAGPVRLLLPAHYEHFQLLRLTQNPKGFRVLAARKGRLDRKGQFSSTQPMEKKVLAFQEITRDARGTILLTPALAPGEHYALATERSQIVYHFSVR